MSTKPNSATPTAPPGPNSAEPQSRMRIKAGLDESPPDEIAMLVGALKQGLITKEDMIEQIVQRNVEKYQRFNTPEQCAELAEKLRTLFAEHPALQRLIRQLP